MSILDFILGIATLIVRQIANLLPTDLPGLSFATYQSLLNTFQGWLQFSLNWISPFIDVILFRTYLELLFWMVIMTFTLKSMFWLTKKIIGR